VPARVSPRCRCMSATARCRPSSTPTATPWRWVQGCRPGAAHRACCITHRSSSRNTQACGLARLSPACPLLPQNIIARFGIKLARKREFQILRGVSGIVKPVRSAHTEHLQQTCMVMFWHTHACLMGHSTIDPEVQQIFTCAPAPASCAAGPHDAAAGAAGRRQDHAAQGAGRQAVALQPARRSPHPSAAQDGCTDHTSSYTNLSAPAECTTVQSGSRLCMYICSVCDSSAWCRSRGR
jgi:hypothetical protein